MIKCCNISFASSVLYWNIQFNQVRALHFALSHPVAIRLKNGERPAENKNCVKLKTLCHHILWLTGNSDVLVSFVLIFFSLRHCICWNVLHLNAWWTTQILQILKYFSSEKWKCEKLSRINSKKWSKKLQTQWSIEHFEFQNKRIKVYSLTNIQITNHCTAL